MADRAMASATCPRIRSWSKTSKPCPPLAAAEGEAPPPRPEESHGGERQPDGARGSRGEDQPRGARGRRRRRDRLPLGAGRAAARELDREALSPARHRPAVVRRERGREDGREEAQERLVRVDLP